jgi:hypothetical protein
MLLIAGANDLPIAQSWAQATGQELVSEPSARWAAAVLLSRAFSLDMREAEPLEGAPRCPLLLLLACVLQLPGAAHSAAASAWPAGLRAQRTARAISSGPLPPQAT